MQYNRWYHILYFIPLYWSKCLVITSATIVFFHYLSIANLQIPAVYPDVHLYFVLQIIKLRFFNFICDSSSGKARCAVVAIQGWNSTEMSSSSRFTDGVSEWSLEFLCWRIWWVVFKMKVGWFIGVLVTMGRSAIMMIKSMNDLANGIIRNRRNVFV